MHTPWSVALALLVAACGGTSRREQAPPSPAPPVPPSFEVSPIVFGTLEPPATSFLTLSDRQPKRINDQYNVFSTSLSPKRTRILQLGEDEQGDPRGLFRIFELSPDGAELGSIPARGSFVDFADESTLVLETSDGFELVGFDGSVLSTFGRPADVTRDVNDGRAALSPNRTSIAFDAIQSVGLDDFEAFLVVMDVKSGAELGRWATEGRAAGSWLNDHELVAVAGGALRRFELGETEPVGPIAFDFEPCSVRRADAGYVLLGELVLHGDVISCDERWRAGTDGRSAQQLPFTPIAFSPDFRRLLAWDTGRILVSRPDGSDAEQLELTSSSTPIW